MKQTDCQTQGTPSVQNLAETLDIPADLFGKILDIGDRRCKVEAIDRTNFEHPIRVLDISRNEVRSIFLDALRTAMAGSREHCRRPHA